jgi:hypothetical protein
MRAISISRAVLALPMPLPVVLLTALLAGCQSAPPPPRVSVPRSPEEGPVKTYAQLRPLPEPSLSDRLPAPLFDDVPLVTQAPPELPAYVEAYARVGRPRVAVFVNRDIEGRIIPVEDRRVLAGVEVRRSADGAVDVQSSRSTDVYGRHRDSSHEWSEAFKSEGPATLRESAEIYLPAGQYDEVQSKSIDYEAIELTLADTLAANGKVTLVSPTMVRQRLSDDEVKSLQTGRPQVLREIAEKLDADILIQVQARPTRQTAEGLHVRVLVEAMNTRGGESVARAFVDVPPPLEKTTINRYTRFLARKTMHALAGSWTEMANNPAPKRSTDTPETAPAPR